MKFKLLNRVNHVEYEALHFICFKCGKYVHKKELCSKECIKNVNEGCHDANVIETNTVTLGNNSMKDDFGPWMLVQKDRRGRRRTKEQILEKRVDLKNKSDLRGKKSNINEIIGLRFNVITEMEGIKGMTVR